ncbi:hypothetical protein CAEBREN_16483 [Caenorhabditis brenneri]|uniref:Uncharacterized protein n=1 Tax=Caenorhabditis brenneri TaxID=135651 RepID=G0NLQ8_CAEBE|nr:hypothetical protein CAEBREN_16483 [Caenorhabditis brenneri]
MKTIFLTLFFVLISYATCDSELVSYVFEGDAFKYHLDFVGAEKAFGLQKRYYENDKEKKIFFYFCDKAKGEYKKKCGSWVDEKGNKAKNANNNVTLKGKEVILSKVTEKDYGFYTAVLEDKKLESPNFRLAVNKKPPPPPPSKN